MQNTRMCSSVLYFNKIAQKTKIFPFLFILIALLRESVAHSAYYCSLGLASKGQKIYFDR